MALRPWPGSLRWWRRAARPHAATAGFDAFISYNQKADRVRAEALRTGLHHFARPWYRLRAVRVFRDESSLSASPGLWPTIEDALSRSRHFVLLASPEAAASKWVGKEIEYWRAHKPDGTLLLAVTRGDCRWDEEAGDFDWERSDAVPRALAGAFTAEPYVLDLRGLREPAQLSLGHRAFDDVVARLAARFRGVSIDDIHGEDVRQHRRRLRAMRVTGVVLALLAVVASLAAVVANRNANTAEARLRDGSSRQLAAQALDLKEGSLDTALLLGAQAWRTSDTAAARGGLLSVVQEAEKGLAGFLRLPAGVAAPFALETVAVSQDGRWAFAGHCPCHEFSAGDAGGPDDGRLFVWPTDRTDRRAQVLSPHDKDAGDLEMLLPGADGRFVLSRDSHGRVRLWNTSTHAVRALAPVYEQSWVTSVAEGRYFAAVVAPGKVVFLDALTGRRTATVDGDLLRVSGDATRRPVLAGTDAEGRLVMWDVRTGRALGRGPALGGAPADMPDASFSADGGRVAVLVGAGVDRKAVVLDTDDASVVATMRPPGGGGVPAQVALRPDGKELALVARAGRLSTGAVPGATARLDVLVEVAAEAQVTRLVYSPSGRLLSVTTDDGTSGGVRKQVVTASRGATRAVLHVWGAQFAVGEKLILGWRDTGVEVGNLDTGRATRIDPAPLSAVAMSDDLRYVATAEHDRVRLWDLTSGEARPIELPGVRGSVLALAFAGNGSRLLGTGETGNAVVWDVQRAVRHAFAAQLPFDPNQLTAYDVSKDGKSFVTVLQDGRVQVHDLATGRVRRTVTLDSPLQQSTSATLSPDVRHLLVCCTEATRVGVRTQFTTALVRLSDGRRLRSFDGFTGDVDFSDDGRRFVWLDGTEENGPPTARVYDTARADGPPVATFRVTGFADHIGLHFTLDRTGTRLAATDTVGRTVVHDVATGERVMECTKLMGASAGGSRGIAFHPNGTTVAVASQDSTMRLLAAEADGGCRRLATVPGSSHALAFSPDGSLLLSTGDMRLRDAETLETVGEPLFDDADDPAEIFFTSAGNRLMEVAYDGTVRSLTIDPAELTRRACALAGRDLTREEWQRFGILGDYVRPCADG
ncbi:toll/interleukin-1 receptor domain-containing protein [Streptomyces sp. NPDC051913]|uniref:toll/interleukin-1 receptor domain-containing protein n=1 Tax=Streptomyces sp. NPDC051913 TaxID=3365676 RepID=UPI0037D76623